MSVDLHNIQSWSPIEIPGSSPPVEMAVLRNDRDRRARTLVVRFPAGWHRPGPGYYEASEELVVLDGSFKMSGVDYERGDWGFVPALASRVDSFSEHGATVFARFGGPAEWVDGESGSVVPPSEHRSLLTTAGQAITTEIGPARPLHVEERVASYLLEAPPTGAVAPFDTELLSLTRPRWFFTGKGERYPDFDGTCFCRTFGA